TISLIHDKHIRNLHVSRLPCLHFISRFRHQHHCSHIRKSRNFDSALPYTHRFHNDVIDGKRLHHIRYLDTAGMQSTHGSTSSKRTNEHVRVCIPFTHPNAIAKHCTQVEWRRRVHTKHSYPFSS